MTTLFSEKTQPDGGLSADAVFWGGYIFGVASGILIGIAIMLFFIKLIQ